MQKKHQEENNENKEEKEEKYVVVCPKCKSPDISRDNSNPLSPAMGLPSIYACNKCGFNGYTFPEVPISELEDFKNQSKKENLLNVKDDKSLKVDTSYGTFVVKIWWKIIAPIALLGGILLLFQKPTSLIISGAIFTVFGLVMCYLAYFKRI